jgi:hypothetical protein
MVLPRKLRAVTMAVRGRSQLDLHPVRFLYLMKRACRSMLLVSTFMAFMYFQLPAMPSVALAALAAQGVSEAMVVQAASELLALTAAPVEAEVLPTAVPVALVKMVPEVLRAR